MKVTAAFLLLVISMCALGEQGAQTPKSAGVTKGSPAVASKAKNEAQSGQHPAKEAPPPIQVFQPKKGNSNAAEGESSADKYQRDNLEAQQGAVKAAEKQVNATCWAITVEFLGTIVAAIALGFLIKTFKQTQIAAVAARDSANAAAAATLEAVEGNRLSRELFIAEQRPWISMEAWINGPLQFKRINDQDCWAMPLGYGLKNMGKTPATTVEFFASIVPYTGAHIPGGIFLDGVPQGDVVPGTDIPKEIEDVCSFHEGFADREMKSGPVLFPGEKLPGVFILRGNPRIFEAAKSGYYLNSFLIICGATYRTSLGKNKYRTAKVFQLSKASGKINLSGEDVQSENLIWTLCPTNSGYAT